MDLRIVQWLHTWATASPFATGVSIALARWLIVGIAVFAVGALLRLPRGGRKTFTVDLLMTVATAYLLAQVIGILWFRERPFVRASDIQPLLALSPTFKSFPSDHATIAFAMALPLLRAYRLRPVRALVLLAAAGVALGRVLVGVHYPTDVVGGAVLALVVCVAVRWVRAKRKNPHAFA